MVRGSYLDVAVLDTDDVSARGNLTNSWTGSQDAVSEVGGDMDLVTGAKRVYVIMRQSTNETVPRMRRHCRFSLTVRGLGFPRLCGPVRRRAERESFRDLEAGSRGDGGARSRTAEGDLVLAGDGNRGCEGPYPTGARER